MTWQRPSERRARVRRADDRAWTVGEHRDFEDDVWQRFDRLEAKVDRLTWIVAVGSGVVATSAFALGLVATLHPF